MAGPFSVGRMESSEAAESSVVVFNRSLIGDVPPTPPPAVMDDMLPLPGSDCRLASDRELATPTTLLSDVDELPTVVMATSCKVATKTITC